MQAKQAKIRGTFAALLCLSLVVWSVLPTYSHAPAVFETIQDHLQMVEDHGHSHGFEEDLIWAMHGHSHDAADHDHGQAFLLSLCGPALDPTVKEVRRTLLSSSGSSRQFPIDRPPRA